VAISSAASLVDVQLVVLGGGVSASGELMMGAVRESLETHAGLQFLSRLTVVTADDTTEPGVVGAAALALPDSVYWNP
jgi:glucokinase